MIGRVVAVFVVAISLLFGVTRAFAQGGVEVSARLSSDVVEVGEAFVLELSAMSGDNARFSDPLVRLPSGLVATGPSVGSKSLVQMGATGTMFRRGISAKWRIVASAPGKFTIPPPSVRAGGKAVEAQGALRVTVVQAGQKPASRRSIFDPFGMGSPFDNPLDDFLREAAQKREGDLIVDEPAPDPEALGEEGRALSLDRGDDAHLFLRIVPDKTSVVVGEQVTLRYLEYYRVTNERFDEREPKLPDFLKAPLDDEPGQSQRLTTSVGGRLWFVQELDRVAVFPLRAGSLHTGKVSARFRIPYLKEAQPRTRSSNDVAIEVREPPLEDRPPGYRVGDVGQFRLSATITPTTTVAGETVSVKVKVEGRGVMPNQLRVPERAGVEWLTPEKHDETELRGGRVGGSRTFGYAVRLTEEGPVELGWVELPYFDPDEGRYGVARAALGKIMVQAGQGASTPLPSSANADDDPFATLPKPRRKLGKFEPTHRRAPSAGMLLGLTTFPALAVLLGGLALRGTRAAGARWRNRQTMPEHLARKALDDLRAAGSPEDAASVCERAVHLAIEAVCGLRSRGVLLDALPEELSRRGLSEALVADVQAVLKGAAAIRYEPGLSSTDSLELERRTRQVVASLLRLEAVEAS